MKVGVLYPEYGTGTAISVRLEYFLKALRTKFDVIEVRFNLGTKLNRLLWYIYPKTLSKIVQKLRNADVVLASIPPPITAIIAKLAKDMHGTRYVVDVRDVWEAYAETQYPKIIVELIVKKYISAVKESDAVIVTTEAMAEHYKKIFNKNIEVIPNGSDPDIIKCNNIERPYDLAVVADFNTPYQNLDLVLKVLTKTNYTLLIIGSGRYLEYYRNLATKYGIANRIRFVGRVPYEKLRNYLCMAKIGIVGRPFIHNPEYLYTIPTKVYDYMAAAMPVLAYGPSGSELERFIKIHGIGIYVREPSEDAVIDAITELMKRWRSISETNRKLVEEKFDRKKCAIKLIQLIENIHERTG